MTTSQDDARRVLRAHAERVFEPAAYEAWLQGSNSYLQGARPAHLLEQGRVAEVIEAIKAAEQIAWGG